MSFFLAIRSFRTNSLKILVHNGKLLMYNTKFYFLVTGYLQGLLALCVKSVQKCVICVHPLVNTILEHFRVLDRLCCLDLVFLSFLLLCQHFLLRSFDNIPDTICSVFLLKYVRLRGVHYYHSYFFNNSVCFIPVLVSL